MNDNCRMENLTPTRPARQTITILNHSNGPSLKGINKFKLNKNAFAEGAVGQVFQAIHRETQALYAVKRISKQRA